MSPLVKHLLKKRKQAMRTNDEETITRLQNQINLIHSNQVNTVKNEKNGSKKWWSKVNSMTGKKRKHFTS
jgi:hypothetical protein